ncbi:MAG: ATP-binding protein [Candidatus Hinthialibacter antarcticus]|nr:ATP-binding protein [Candidatus Hinthialibacter antarcticus]
MMMETNLASTQSHNPILIIDIEGRIVDGNPATRSFVGTEQTTIQSLTTNADSLFAAIQESSQSKQPVSAHVKFHEQEYETFVRIVPLSFGAQPGVEHFLLEIESEHGDLQRLEEAARSNDQRVLKLSEQLAFVTRELLDKTTQLAEQKSKTEAIINGMDEGLLGCDETGAIVQFNDVAGRLLQLSRASVLRKLLHEVCPVVSTAVGYSPDEPSSVKKRNINLTIAGRDVRIFSSPIVEDERFVGFVLILLDRTKQAELDRLKADLISIVSHEMRSPLTSIKGYIDLILGGDLGDAPDPLKNYLTIVSQNANRLASLIDDMLDLSRLESGKLSMTFGKVDVNFLCEYVFLSHKPQADQKKIALVRETDENLFISGDNDRLQQALTNLVSNAIKYTPDGGAVEIRASREGEGVVVRVVDNGFGISQADQQRLFQKFFRVKNAQTRHIGGTGLGLCITRTIIEAHHGHISLDSDEGKGSTFSMHFPAYHA